MCHCVWVPRWDVPLKQLPQHAGGKSKFKPVATLVVGGVSGGLPSVRRGSGCLKIGRGGLKTARGLQDAFALSCEREGLAGSHLPSGYPQPALQ